MKQITFILFIVFFISQPIVAQTNDIQSKEDSLKIGLVLSGGAAKGLAHIGVLEVLEEVGIRPDYLTGTSMGAIIGGLYAMGYSPEELREISASIDWDKMMTDQVSLRNIVMEEKEDFERYLVEFPVRNLKLKLPSGLTEGYQIERVLSDLTWPAKGIHNFDSLPIPFHCMAVDLIEGKVVEFDSGDLPTAIRASMAIPGMFTPVQVDSLLLVDGGVIRNLPVEEVINMGADIVIAVYVGFEEEVTLESLSSMNELLTRTTIFMGVIDTKEQKEMADILIKPKLKDIGAMDFGKSDTIIARGKKAAQDVKDKLTQLADSLNLSFNPVKKPLNRKFINISDVKIENVQYVEESFIIGQGNIFPGNYVTRTKINNAVERLYGTGYFRKVGYRLEHKEDNKFNLVYKIKENSRAFLKLAPHYDNQLGTGITFNGTFRNYIIPSSRIKLTLNIAENPGMKFNAHKYVGKEQKLMLHNFVWWSRTKLPVFYEEENIGNYTHRLLKTGVGSKYSLSFNQQAGFDFFYERNNLNPGGGVKAYYPEADFENYGFGGFAFQTYFKHNTLNDIYFATRGTKLDIELKRVMKPIVNKHIREEQSIEEEILKLNLKPFNTLYFNYDNYFEIDQRSSLKFGTSAGFVSKQTPITNFFALGGVLYTDKYTFESFYGMNLGELVVPNFWKIDGKFNYRIKPRIFLTAAGNVLYTDEKVDRFFKDMKNTKWQDITKGFAMGVRINSLIGPIKLMVGDVSTDARLRWYFSLGYSF
ncbi:MAG: patatin-like phospholipase family protein [Bacteroidales bacterium]